MVRWSSRLVESSAFQRTILAFILLAAVVVGLETSADLMARHGPLLHAVDAVILAVFVAEVLLKLIARWPRPWAYFADGWNVFDFLIVAFCLLPVGDTHFAAVLRLARVLRVLRLVSAVPRLQLLVGALLKSFPSMGYVGLLLSIHFYIYAVLGVFLFGPHDPAGFGTLGSALLTLFQIVTLEGWVDVMNLQVYGPAGPIAGQSPGGPWPLIAPAYFITFILLGTMIMLNLFIGVIMNGMTEAHEEQENVRHAADRPGSSAEALFALQRQAEALTEQVRQLQRTLERERSGPPSGAGPAAR